MAEKTKYRTGITMTVKQALKLVYNVAKVQFKRKVFLIGYYLIKFLGPLIFTNLNKKILKIEEWEITNYTDTLPMKVLLSNKTDSPPYPYVISPGPLLYFVEEQRVVEDEQTHYIPGGIRVFNQASKFIYIYDKKFFRMTLLTDKGMEFLDKFRSYILYNHLNFQINCGRQVKNISERSSYKSTQTIEIKPILEVE